MTDATQDWRVAIFALETDDNETSKALHSEVVSFVKAGDGSGGALTPRKKGRYSLITRDDLSQIAAEQKFPADSSQLVKALAHFVKQESVAGKVRKANSSADAKTKIADSKISTNATIETSVDGVLVEPQQQQQQQQQEEDNDDPEAMERLAKKAEIDEQKQKAQENFDSAVAALDEVKEVGGGCPFSPPFPFPFNFHFPALTLLLILSPALGPGQNLHPAQFSQLDSRSRLNYELYRVR